MREKVRLAFDLLVLGLFVLALVQMAQASGDTPTARPSEERGMVKLPVSVKAEFGYCLLGQDKVPCAYLTVNYEDGSKEKRLVSEHPDGKWKNVLRDLGDAIDHVQADHDWILKERRHGAKN